MKVLVKLRAVELGTHALSPQALVLWESTKVNPRPLAAKRSTRKVKLKVTSKAGLVEALRERLWRVGVYAHPCSSRSRPVCSECRTITRHTSGRGPYMSYASVQ